MQQRRGSWIHRFEGPPTSRRTDQAQQPKEAENSSCCTASMAIGHNTVSKTTASPATDENVSKQMATLDRFGEINPCVLDLLSMW